MAANRRARARTALERTLVAALLLAAARGHAQDVRHLGELEREIPLDPSAPATIKEIARGDQSSVNFWQTARGIPPHVHRDHEETIVVEEGRAEARIGDRTVTLSAGDVVLVPRNAVHSARVVSSEPFRGYSVFAPPFDGKDRVPVEEPPPAP